LDVDATSGRPGQKQADSAYTPEQARLLALFETTKNRPAEWVELRTKLSAEEHAALNEAWNIQDAEIRRQATCAVTAARQVDIAPPLTAPTGRPPRVSVTGKLAAVTRGKRHGVLMAVYFNAPGGAFRQRFRHSELFIAWLSGQVGSDVSDPELVPPEELSRPLDLPPDDILYLEAGSTKYRDERDRIKGRRPRKRPYVTDLVGRGMTAAQMTKWHRKIRDERKRERKRTTKPMESTTMQHTMQTQTQPTFATYAAQMAAMMANVRAQEQALLDAMRPERNTIAELMARVATHPSWAELAAGKRASFHRIICRRLDALEEGRRIPPSTYMGGIRIVRPAPG
jgi:hypothetical protein